MNVNKLKGKIVENELSLNDLANELDIDRSTLYRKLSNNGETLTIREVNKICEILNLSKDEAVSIFFTSTVA